MHEGNTELTTVAVNSIIIVISPSATNETTGQRWRKDEDSGGLLVYSRVFPEYTWAPHP